MDAELTRDAEYLLCVLYDAYRQRRKNGESSRDAKFFGGSEQIQENYIQHWPTQDIDDAAFALYDEGMLEALFEADELIESALTNTGIAHMEHQFGNKFDRLTQRIATLRTMLFG